MQSTPWSHGYHTNKFFFLLYSWITKNAQLELKCCTFSLLYLEIPLKNSLNKFRTSARTTYYIRDKLFFFLFFHFNLKMTTFQLSNKVLSRNWNKISCVYINFFFVISYLLKGYQWVYSIILFVNILLAICWTIKHKI